MKTVKTCLQPPMASKYLPTLATLAPFHVLCLVDGPIERRAAGTKGHYDEAPFPTESVVLICCVMQSRKPVPIRLDKSGLKQRLLPKLQLANFSYVHPAAAGPRNATLARSSALYLGTSVFQSS